MKFKVTEVVRGFQNMTYNIDGKDVFTKCIFIDAAMNEDTGGKGFKTVPKTCVSPDVIASVAHNAFPMECELEMEELATKNKSELFVRSIRPLRVVGPGAGGKVAAA
jgi:hypothetical protein